MAKLESRTPMRRMTLPTGQSAKIPRQPANTRIDAKADRVLGR
jgi:hypothetical protein